MKVRKIFEVYIRDLFFLNFKVERDTQSDTTRHAMTRHDAPKAWRPDATKVGDELRRSWHKQANDLSLLFVAFATASKGVQFSIALVVLVAFVRQIIRDAKQGEYHPALGAAIPDPQPDQAKQTHPPGWESGDRHWEDPSAPVPVEEMIDGGLWKYYSYSELLEEQKKWNKLGERATARLFLNIFKRWTGYKDGEYWKHYREDFQNVRYVDIADWTPPPAQGNR